MNYQKVYDQLVQKNHTFSEGEYFETHHKVPLSLGGTDDKSNLVDLTAREHYIAHLLLVKIAKGNNDIKSYRKMLHAFNCMKWGRCKGKRSFKFNSRLYQKVKEEYSKLRRSVMKSESNPMHNKIWIYSDELRQNKCWDKNSQIPFGWSKGRIVNWERHFVRRKKPNGQKKRCASEERIKQVQEIANYYMEYGFDKTQKKYKPISPGLASLESMLAMFSHYKQHYGIHFTARNNTPGIINGSYFKKDV